MGPDQGGSGLEGALKSLGQGLSAVSQDESVPEGARAAFQASLQAFQEGLEILGGGGEAPPSEPVSMEQGASKGAVPMSMGRPS